MKTLSVLGAGRVGQTLGRLFNDKKIFKVVNVYNRTPEKAVLTTQFIGNGAPVCNFADLTPTDVYMITCPDDSLSRVCAELINSNVIKKGNIVFQCSGVLPSTILNDLKKQGCLIASIHPIKSFADPNIAITDFAGTFCGVEGEPEAIEILKPAFAAIGARIIEINADKKAIYHAATAQACNNLIGLMESAILMYIESGLTRQQALDVMKPIVTGTVKNIFAMDTTNALTGPIARGDAKTIDIHLDALQDDNLAQNIYAMLGLYVLDLARKKAGVDPANLDKIENNLLIVLN